MDGVGLSKDKKYNALYNAYTPNLNRLWDIYPHSSLNASEKYVGLPKGQMGNSEVGHTNIGAGRIVYQSLELINSKINDAYSILSEDYSRGKRLYVIQYDKADKYGMVSYLQSQYDEQ